MLILISLGLFSFWLGILGLINYMRESSWRLANTGVRLHAQPPQEATPPPNSIPLTPKNKPENPEIVRAFQDLWNELLRGA